MSQEKKFINISYNELNDNLDKKNNINETGKLFICPTPIGNLEDITYRTLRILNEVDMIAAEDTRHSLKLLNHFNISKPLTSYHKFNEMSKGDNLIEKLIEGKNIAVISDAGMPGISDPGETIIKKAIENNIEIEVLPGASAFVVALVSSGLDTGKFVFEGFLDRDKKLRKKRLDEIKEEDRTIIIYESPHRLKECLKDILSIFGNRKICICREITKKYEEFLRGNIDNILDNLSQRNEIKGEFVLVIEGFKGEKTIKNDFEFLSDREYVVELINQGMSKKDAIKKVCKERKLKKDVVYQQVLDI